MRVLSVRLNKKNKKNENKSKPTRFNENQMEKDSQKVHLTFN